MKRELDITNLPGDNQIIALRSDRESYAFGDPSAMVVVDRQATKDTARSGVRDMVARQCGRGATCLAEIDLKTRESADPNLHITAAAVQCVASECPLDEDKGLDGGSGDREPRNPLPAAPGMQEQIRPPDGSILAS